MAVLGEGAYARVIDYQDDEGTWAMKYYTIPRGGGLSAAYREIEMLTYLVHPNVIRLHSVHVGAYSAPTREGKGIRTRPMAEVDGELHIVMEKGSLSLQRRMRKHMTPEVIKSVVRDILLALEYIHRNGVIHRDLSDGNVLLMEDGRVCICDFGMSKHHLSEAEVNDTYVHPFVRSPEMHERSYYDFRSDIWSLGVIMTTMMLGINPFAEGNDYIYQLIRHIPLCPDSATMMVWIKRCTSGEDLRRYERVLEERKSGQKSIIEDMEDEDAKDFIKCCLAFHRKHRWEASSLLEHPWLKSEKAIIEKSREEHLMLTMPNPRAWSPVLLPSSAIRSDIRDYIVKYQEKFAQQIDRRVSRICLALNVFYRTISHRDTSEEIAAKVDEEIEKGYALHLFIVCTIVTLKYCGTNDVPRAKALIPSGLLSTMDGYFIKERELLVMATLNNLYYQHTTYDILIRNNIRVTEESATQVWMRYLGGETRTCNVEEEYEEVVKKMIQNGEYDRRPPQATRQEGDSLGGAQE